MTPGCFTFYILLFRIPGLLSPPMFEAVKVQLTAAAEKLAHLRRFL